MTSENVGVCGVYVKRWTLRNTEREKSQDENINDYKH